MQALPRGVTHKQLVQHFKKAGCQIVAPAPEGGLGSAVLETPEGQIFGVPNCTDKCKLYDRTIELLQRQLDSAGVHMGD